MDISYDYLKKILEDFDGGAYSFQEHLKKPNPAFFEVLLNHYRLDPSETIFFDDREKNVVAAQNLGMKAAVFTDIDTITNALENWEILGFNRQNYRGRLRFLVCFLLQKLHKNSPLFL